MRVARELNYQRLRVARRAALFAKSSASRKATEVANRIRGKAATSLQIARNIHRDVVSRLKREHDDACQAAVQNEIKRLEGLQVAQEAALHVKHYTDVDQFRKLRDAEILILKKQHEAENGKLLKTLDRVLQKTKNPCTH